MKIIIALNLENHQLNKISAFVIFLTWILISGAFFPQSAAFAWETSRPELFTAIYRGDLARARAAIASGSDVNGIYDRDTMLCWAMRNENQAITKLILGSPRLEVDKRGVWYDSFGEWERTPLILAAHMGQAETVSTLLQLGAQVNARGSKGNTALIMAAQRDHTEAIRVLLTQGKGIRVDAQTRGGRTPLSFVVEAEDLVAVKLLHSHGAKINQPDRQGDSMLIGAFLHKGYEVLDFLVARGANINMVNNGGVTTLMKAILLLGGHDAKTVLTFLEKFITFKPKLDLQQIKGGNGGHTALHLAARFGYVEGGKLLLDNGAGIDLKSLATGGTPLHNAAGANQIKFAELLINRRANLEIFDKSGATPLIIGVFHGDADMVEVLVDAGAKINVKSPVNILVTPLVYAASNPDPFKHTANLTIIKLLVKHKGDINFPSANGRTALIAAAGCSDQSKAYEKGALLIDSGASLDLVNDKGETALMLAAGAGNKKLVTLLIDKGANAQLKNGAGESVMSYANRSGNKGSIRLLESKGVKSEVPIVHKSVIVPALVGTWKGFQDGMPQALYTIVLNQNGTFDFNSRLTPEFLKNIPKGSMNPVIAAQKGKYTFNNELMIWNIVGAPPTSMKWKLENGMLILDNKIRLNKRK